MATDNNCKGIKVLDPVTGLLDYVQNVKPYHTKVVEVLVEYVFNVNVDVTILDNFHLHVELIPFSAH